MSGFDGYDSDPNQVDERCEVMDQHDRMETRLQEDIEGLGFVGVLIQEIQQHGPTSCETFEVTATFGGRNPAGKWVQAENLVQRYVEELRGKVIESNDSEREKIATFSIPREWRRSERALAPCCRPLGYTVGLLALLAAVFVNASPYTTL